MAKRCLYRFTQVVIYIALKQHCNADSQEMSFTQVVIYIALKHLTEEEANLLCVLPRS